MGVIDSVESAAQPALAEDNARLTLAYWRCGVALLAVWLSLRVLGFSRTLEAVRRLSEGRVPVSVQVMDVRRAARRVAAVAAFFPGRALCLEQSIALYVLLRRRRVAVQLRVGVHPAPFVAHAWIEYEGVPVNEDEDRIRELLPLPIAAAADL